MNSEKAKIKGSDNLKVVAPQPYATCIRCGCWRGELGSEPTVDAFIAHLVLIFREVKRVLRPDGVCWVNMGSSFSSGSDPSIPAKNNLLVPFRFALAAQADGWIVRQDIIWSKLSAMPESVRDRCTTSHEYVFMLIKSPRYFADMDAVRQPHVDPERGLVSSVESKNPHNGRLDDPGRQQASWVPAVRQYNPLGANLRSVWTLSPEPFPESHFATFPSELPRRCLAIATSARGCCPACRAPWRRVVERERMGDRGKVVPTYETFGVLNRRMHPGEHRRGASETIGWEPSCVCPPAEPVPCRCLDPFVGSGTTLLVADRMGLEGHGIELNPEYAAMAERRIRGDAPLLASVEVVR